MDASVLTSPTGAPLDFPSCSEALLGGNECIACPCQSASKSEGGDVIWVPAKSPDDGKRFFSIIKDGLHYTSHSSNTILGDFVYNSAAFQDLLTRRTQYLDAIDELSTGLKNPPLDLAVKNSNARKIIRGKSRAGAMRLEGMFYKLIDMHPKRVRSQKILEQNLRILKAGPPDNSNVLKVAKKVYDNSTKPNTALTHDWIKINKDYAKYLKTESVWRRVNYVVIAAQVSSATYDVYRAETEDETRKAYVNLVETGAGIVGAHLGALGGSAGAAFAVSVFAITPVGAVMVVGGIVGGIAGGFIFGESAKAIAESLLLDNDKPQVQTTGTL